MTADARPVLDAEDRLLAAQAANDVNELGRLLVDDLAFVGLDGVVVGKADDLAAHRARRLRVARCDVEDRTVRVLGPVAVVLSRIRMAGTYDGAPFESTLCYTRVWAEGGDGAWRVAAGHVSAVPG